MHRGVDNVWMHRADDPCRLPVLFNGQAGRGTPPCKKGRTVTRHELGSFPCTVREVLPVMVGDSLRERTRSEGLPEAPALWSRAWKPYIGALVQALTRGQPSSGVTPR
jgi:hypothetical protein